MPSYQLKEDDFNENSIDILSVLVKSNLATSRSEARRAVEQGGVSLDSEKITDIQFSIEKSKFVNDGIVVKKGKKKFIRVFF